VDAVARLRFATAGTKRQCCNLANVAADQFEDDAEPPWIDRPPVLTTGAQQVQWSRNSFGYNLREIVAQAFSTGATSS
jgi:hypothetical protein